MASRRGPGFNVLRQLQMPVMPTSLINKPSSKRWRWLAVPAVMAVATLAWWVSDRGEALQQGRGGTAASSSASLWPMQASVGQAPDPLLIPREPVSDARPADFTPEDWAMLNKALEGLPDKAQERNRLVAYLRFQRGVSQWRELQGDPNVAGRQALARALLELLPPHVAQGEVNAGEALMMLGALAQDLEPDPARRPAWVDAQRLRLQGTQTDAQRKVLDDERRKNEQFAAQQAEIVARWQSSPEASQDPQTLEQQLQALREKVYGSGQP